MRFRALLATVVAGSAVLVAPVSVASASAPAPISLGCSAFVSAAHPKPNTVVTVGVRQTSDKVKTSVVAGFKSGAVTAKVQGNAAGYTRARFAVGNAKKGQRVPVSVKAVQGNLSWVCSTSFVVG